MRVALGLSRRITVAALSGKATSLIRPCAADTVDSANTAKTSFFIFVFMIGSPKKSFNISHFHKGSWTTAAVGRKKILVAVFHKRSHCIYPYRSEMVDR
jgi:hypothetical protein